MKFDRDVWFRENDASSIKDVKASVLASSRDGKRFVSRYLSIVSANNPIDLFKEWKPTNFNFEITKKKNFYLIKIIRTIKRKNLPNGHRKISGEMGIFKNMSDNSWTVFTHDTNDFFKNVVKSFIEFYRPEISPIYLSSEEIKSLMYTLSKKSSCKIFSKRAISRNPSGTEMKFNKPKPIEYVFEESYENNNYVDLIEFLMKRDRETILHASISRSGVSTFHFGNIDIFFNDFLNLISEIGLAKAELFSNKQQLYGDRTVHPINLVYDNDVFISQRDNKKLISVLSKLEHSSIAVIHNNPYIHLALLDYLDGSSFDIFVDSPNSISFIPRFNASFSSINKIIQRVFEGFGEGKIKEENGEIDPLESVFISE